MKLSLEHDGVTRTERTGVMGYIASLLRGKRSRVSYKKREREQFEEEARDQFEELKKKGLGIHVFTL